MYCRHYLHLRNVVFKLVFLLVIVAIVVVVIANVHAAATMIGAIEK